MLKYLIVLATVALCSSAPGLVGEWYLLSLLQHSPVASFFASEQRDVNTSDTDFLQYVADHWTEFDRESWIINKFWAIDEVGYPLDNCRTYDGTKPQYTGLSSSPWIKNDLKIHWPNLKGNELNEELWGQEFNTSGSCISFLDFFYFNTALRLLDSHNIGNVLKKNGIHSGHSYAFDDIVKSIVKTIGRGFYIKCLQPENTDKQYLLEVQICFNSARVVQKCFPGQDRPSIRDCDPNKEVFYP